MASPSDSMLQNQQGKYVRARENPIFDGLRSGNSSMNSRSSMFSFMGRSRKQKISRSPSVNDPKGHADDIPDNVSYSSSKASQLDIKHDPFRLSLPGSIDFDSSQISDVHSERSINVEYSNNMTDATNLSNRVENGMQRVEKSYIADKTKQALLGVPLFSSAASFYCGYLPRTDIVESCQSIRKLNMYLKACKDAVNAGVPGKFLRAVLGHVSDAGSFISTIMYSFYLNETDKSSLYYIVPVISIRRSELNSHSELIWLLNSCNIDQPSLLFIDEVDLSYYDLFGSLKIVLLNVDKLPEKQEALKDSVVEIFNCKKGGVAYNSDDTVVDEQDCSCCALIAEKFADTKPEILVGKGFSRLLLAGILLDTENLTSLRCTSVDRYMSTLLLNGAGRFGCNGLYQILRDKMYNVSHLSVGQILQKDFRKWIRTGKTNIRGTRSVVSDVGMSTIRISIPQLLSHDETAIQEIVLFQQLEKLRLLVIVSGYYDHHKNFKEMLISAESKDTMKNLLHFIDTHASRLALHVSHQSGLSNEMRAFTMDNVASRTTMEEVLHDFCITLKASL